MLYDYPAKTAQRRVIPKSRIFAEGGASAALQTRFARQVDQIIWAHILAPRTINLPPTREVEEIDILHITPKGDDVDDDILRAIDRAIPRQVIFEIHTPLRAQTVAGYKRPSVDGRGNWVMADDYLRGPWAAPGTRIPLPVALDLGQLYHALLSPLIAAPARAGEALESRLARAAQIRAQQRVIDQLTTKMRRESQFNIKATLYSQLAEAQAAFDHMTKGASDERD